MNNNSPASAICVKIIDHYGEAKQLAQCQEECVELIAAISHYLRGKERGLEELIEEVADAQICLWQMRIILSRQKRGYQYAVTLEEKLDRMLERMNKAKPMTELQTFAQKVLEVRKLQKDYFDFRAPSTLSKCKRLEKELDREIELILHPETRRQGALL